VPRPFLALNHLMFSPTSAEVNSSTASYWCIATLVPLSRTTGLNFSHPSVLHLCFRACGVMKPC
jgi:hypothetical protein